MLSDHWTKRRKAQTDRTIVVATRDTSFGEIRILKNRRTGCFSYIQGGYSQSEADSNGVSLTSYIHAIYGLLAQTAAERILMIGCGGGTLATMLAKDGRDVAIVDINPASIALAQRYFSLPPDVRCHVDDGQIFLKRSLDTYDAIVVDAFLGGEAPCHLGSLKFFQLARQRLTDQGCILVNLMVNHDLDDNADAVAARMVQSGLPVRLLDMPGKLFRNAIAIGGAVKGLRPPTLLVRPAAACDELSDDLEDMRLRAWRPSMVRYAIEGD
jgi:spermidine synthase